MGGEGGMTFSTSSPPRWWYIMDFKPVFLDFLPDIFAEANLIIIEKFTILLRNAHILAVISHRTRLSSIFFINFVVV